MLSDLRLRARKKGFQISSLTSKQKFVTKNVKFVCYSLKNISNLKKLPEAIKKCLKGESNVQLMAKEFISAKGSMFLGRGSSFPIALEGALKLKELSYLHAEGYPCLLYTSDAADE